ncbi:MAG: 2-oxoacid:acceptor oxidoreductase subunit alpha [Sulfolobales archaeon]
MRVDYVNGNTAIAEGAITAGLRFYAGYPITPSSDIFEYLSRRLPEVGGYAIQLEDEIASINAVIGASWCCVKSMTATSGPGFSLMVEGLSIAVMTETPLVIAYVMRAGPATGVPTKTGQYDVLQAVYGFHGGLIIPVLAPSTPQEAYDLTIKAFNISEKLRTPVILLSDAVLANTFGRVAMRSAGEIEIIERKKPTKPPHLYKPYEAEEDLVPPMACIGDGYDIYVETLTHDERGVYAPTTHVQRKLMERLYKKIIERSEEIFEYRITRPSGSCDYMIISYGSTALSARVAVKELENESIKACLLTINTLYPINEKALRKLCEESSMVFVVENNLGLYYREIRGVIRDKPVISIPVIDLEIPDPNEIKRMVRKWVER